MVVVVASAVVWNRTRDVDDTPANIIYPRMDEKENGKPCSEQEAGSCQGNDGD